MGQVTSLFIRKVIRQVDGNIDTDALLRSVGIEPDDPVDPKKMVPADEYYSLLEKFAAVDRNATALPLRVGASMHCDNYSAFGLAWKSADNLRGSFARAERYARVLSNVSTYELERTENGAYMHLHREGERRLGMRISNEASIASVFSISQEVSTQEFKPIAVYFKHPAPESITDHETHFGCPVHFDSDKDALLVSDESLQVPNHLGDEAISKFFDTHLEAELSELEDNNSLDQRLRIHISRTLSEGIPAISSVAEHFGMSGRTLQRRLSELDYSYQTLVDESRRQLAKKLLRETDYSLTEVSFMTGFSEQSAFTRAFKRWAGQTPRSFRIDPQK